MARTKRENFFRTQIAAIAVALFEIKPVSALEDTEEAIRVRGDLWSQTVDKFAELFAGNTNFDKEKFSLSCSDGKTDRLFPKVIMEDSRRVEGEDQEDWTEYEGAEEE